MRVTLMILLAVVLAGCGDSGCVSAAKAKEWTEVGRQNEAAGRIYEAWRAYKAIGMAPPCGFDSKQRTIANEDRRRLSTEINLAYEATKTAIEAFEAANGHPPASLAEISSDIPDSARRAFLGFRYTVNPETGYYVLDGYAS